MVEGGPHPADLGAVETDGNCDTGPSADRSADRRELLVSLIRTGTLVQVFHDACGNRRVDHDPCLVGAWDGAMTAWSG